MTAQEFASLLHAKSLRRGHWIARCPAHGDKRPSLSIAEGRKHPVVFKCMSQGCTQEEVLSAMGLTWKDLLGERPQMTPEIRSRLRDEQELRVLLELKHSLIVSGYLLEKAEMYDGTKAVNIQVDTQVPENLTRMIRAVENRLSPELKAIRARDAKTARFVRRWCWDKLWELFLKTDEGKELKCQNQPG